MNRSFRFLIIAAAALPGLAIAAPPAGKAVLPEAAGPFAERKASPGGCCGGLAHRALPEEREFAAKAGPARAAVSELQEASRLLAQARAVADGASGESARGAGAAAASGGEGTGTARDVAAPRPGPAMSAPETARALKDLSAELRSAAALLRSASERLERAGDAAGGDRLPGPAADSDVFGPLQGEGAPPAAGAERFPETVVAEVRERRKTSALTDEEALVLARNLQKQDREIERAATVREIVEQRGGKIDAKEATVLSTAVWPKRPRIPVYFENATDEELRTECEWIRKIIEKTWEAAADIDFTEWKRPPQDAKGGIRIVFKPDGHPHCKALGRHIEGMRGGMVLTNTFTAYPCEFGRRKCIEFVAVHEFGHALGFAHEQNRSDAPAACQLERQGTVGDNPVTIYDPASVMNYCNRDWTDAVLSKKDEEACVKLYGKKP